MEIHGIAVLFVKAMMLKARHDGIVGWGVWSYIHVTEQGSLERPNKIVTND